MELKLTLWMKMALDHLRYNCLILRKEYKMIEVQIKSPELFNQLKQYASYHSELTGVCSFRDEMKNMLIDNGVEIKREVNITKEKPKLDIVNGKVMKLINAPAEMLSYVGCRTEFDPTIALKDISQVARLVEAGLVETTSKFDNLYSKLSYRSKISELVCSNIKVYGKGRLIDFIDKDLTIQSMKFADPNEIKETTVVYRNMKLEVIEPLKEVTGKRYVEIKCQDNYRNIYLRFYQRSSILKSIAFEGNRINIAVTKFMQGPGDSLIAYDPIILPEGLTLIKDVAVSPRKRTIPPDLFRYAYYEFLFRYNRK